MKQFDPKQPWEEYYLGFDFARLLGSETVASALFTVTESGEDVTATMLDGAQQYNAGAVAYCWIRAGTTGKNYIITCQVTGSAGSKYEDEGRIRVKET